MTHKIKILFADGVCVFIFVLQNYAQKIGLLNWQNLMFLKIKIKHFNIQFVFHLQFLYLKYILSTESTHSKNK